MCGFVALLMLHGRSPSRALVEEMRDQMVHRGPDGAGLHIEGPIALGHRRLSIIDQSSAGHQPMSNEDQTIWLTFNGEIYNYVELTRELEARGHQFKSHTDTEVIVHLWEEMGERCVERLNGMFAFALWDSRQQLLFGARDRGGIKPFHYYKDGQRFSAASEIKAILADPAVSAQPDYEGLSDCLMTGFPLGEKSCFAGIRQLPPGCALTVRAGELRTWQYWDLEFNYNQSRSLENTVGEVTDLLEDAIRIHCRSDAPLGSHLSGGLDSSAIAAFSAPHRDPLRTFSIRFDGGAYFDESSYARQVAAHLGTEHFEAVPSADGLANRLSRLAWHADIPMPDHSSYSYFTAAQLAASHVKVAMTGHGGDEIFAGYPAQFEATYGHTRMFDLSQRPVAHVPLLTRTRMALRRHGLAGLARRVLARNHAPAADDLDQRWLHLHCGAPPVESPLLLPAFRAALQGYDPRPEYLAPLFRARTDQTLDRCLYHDLRSYLPSLLHQEDRASMALSIESRVPLLDYRLVEFLATVPPDQKVNGLIPKALLRQAVREKLPPAITARRDKGAFGVPLQQWFAGPLAPMVKELTQSRRAVDRGIFDPVELQSGWHGSAGLWTAMSVELWFRLFIDRDRDWLDRVERSAA